MGRIFIINLLQINDYRDTKNEGEEGKNPATCRYVFEHKWENKN